MDISKAVRVVFLLVLVAVLISIVAGSAYAAGAEDDQMKKGDSKISMKKGLEALDQDPKKKVDGATKLQKIIGLGSLVVMIIVVKFV